MNYSHHSSVLSSNFYFRHGIDLSSDLYMSVLVVIHALIDSVVFFFLTKSIQDLFAYMCDTEKLSPPKVRALSNRNAYARS
jgi:hypothetical protein